MNCEDCIRYRGNGRCILPFVEQSGKNTAHPEAGRQGVGGHVLSMEDKLHSIGYKSWLNKDGNCGYYHTDEPIPEPEEEPEPPVQAVVDADVVGNSKETIKKSNVVAGWKSGYNNHEESE